MTASLLLMFDAYHFEKLEPVRVRHRVSCITKPADAQKRGALGDISSIGRESSQSLFEAVMLRASVYKLQTSGMSER